MREGKRLVTDGPFAETREQLGGYYLVNCANLDEALALAARIPSARFGTIDVRPLVEADGLAASRDEHAIVLGPVLSLCDRPWSQPTPDPRRVSGAGR